MSHGPGRIERAVEQTLRGADRSFTVEELATFAYPTIAVVEKKHRVAILRTFNSVEKKLPLWFFRTVKPPWRLIVTNRNSVRSYVHGYLRVYWWDAERSLDLIEKILNDPEVQSVMQPGGVWWTDVEINKAEAEHRDIMRLLETKGLATPLNPYWGSWRWKNDEEPPEYEESIAYLNALRHYRVGLLTYGHEVCYEPLGRFLLGRFEPPGTSQFEYAMKLRADAVAP
jgi:hypothetical protein